MFISYLHDTDQVIPAMFVRYLHDKSKQIYLGTYVKSQNGPEIHLAQNVILSSRTFRQFPDPYGFLTIAQRWRCNTTFSYDQP